MENCIIKFQLWNLSTQRLFLRNLKLEWRANVIEKDLPILGAFEFLQRLVTNQEELLVVQGLSLGCPMQFCSDRPMRAVGETLLLSLCGVALKTVFVSGKAAISGNNLTQYFFFLLLSQKRSLDFHFLFFICLK